MNIHIVLVLALVAGVSQGHAQERVAGGASLANEASWSALKNLINKVEGDVTTQKILLNAVVECNKVGKLYAPGTTGVDSKGCKTIATASAPTPPTPTPTPSPAPSTPKLTSIGGGNCSPKWCAKTQSTHCGGGSTGCASTWTFWGVGRSGGCSEGESTYSSGGYSFTCMGYR